MRPLEQLRDTAQYIRDYIIPPNPQFYRFRHTPDTSYTSLHELTRNLKHQGIIDNPNALLLADYDGVCRQQNFSNLWKLRLGEITQDEIQLLEYLESQAVNLVVVTNQLDSEHWFAQALGYLHGYETFRSVLTSRGIKYLAAPNRLNKLLVPYKGSTNAIQQTIELMNSIQQIETFEHIVVVGDQRSDMIYADNLFTQLATTPGFKANTQSYWIQKHIHTRIPKAQHHYMTVQGIPT